MTAEDDDQGGSVRAVVRAIDILKSFEDANGALSVAEIQNRVPLSRPTLYRLIDTLISTGMLFSEGEPQRLRLGRTAARLGQLWAAQFEIDAVAKPILDELRDATGESCGLFKIQNDRQYCILESRSRHPLAMTRGTGELLDGFHGASGKAILAWMPTTEALRIATESSPKGSKPITKKELQIVHENGYALSQSAIFKGATSVAAPVFDMGTHIFGSLAVFGPEARLTGTTLKRATELVRAAAQELSAQFGAAGHGQ
jgi:DNA-binding IclR family transcriptional regulator